MGLLLAGFLDFSRHRFFVIPPGVYHGWKNLGTYNRYQAEEFGRFVIPLEKFFCPSLLLPK
jgi:hypothetical protein